MSEPERCSKFAINKSPAGERELSGRVEAYAYVVNGKPALEWVMERQAVTVDKKSGIENDANLWATQTIGNAKYPLELFLRVITVGLETM